MFQPETTITRPPASCSVCRSIIIPSFRVMACHSVPNTEWSGHAVDRSSPCLKLFINSRQDKSWRLCPAACPHGQKEDIPWCSAIQLSKRKRGFLSSHYSDKKGHKCKVFQKSFSKIFLKAFFAVIIRCETACLLPPLISAICS